MHHNLAAVETRSGVETCGVVGAIMRTTLAEVVAVAAVKRVTEVAFLAGATRETSLFWNSKQMNW